MNDSGQVEMRLELVSVPVGDASSSSPTRTAAAGRCSRACSRASAHAERADYFFLAPRFILRRWVRVVFGLVFAFDFGTKRPVSLERTTDLSLRWAMTGV